MSQLYDWVKEKAWVTEAGLPAECLYNRSMNYRCGYVGVNENSHFYKRDYDECSEISEFEVHGGVTFTGKNNDEDNLWWIGFDCNHYGDGNNLCVEFPVRSLEFVEEECENLARQIMEKEIKNPSTQNELL